MAISSCSIIHYTDEFDKIESIFNDSAFRLKYCAERFVAIGYKKYEFAIAMVSFCDIPLSDYKKHFKNLSNQSGKNARGNLGYYGDYGIGLSKKWAVNGYSDTN